MILYAWGKVTLSLFKEHIIHRLTVKLVGFAFINLQYASPGSFLTHNLPQWWDLESLYYGCKSIHLFLFIGIYYDKNQNTSISGKTPFSKVPFRHPRSPTKEKTQGIRKEKKKKRIGVRTERKWSSERKCFQSVSRAKKLRVTSLSLCTTYQMSQSLNSYLTSPLFRMGLVHVEQME